MIRRIARAAAMSLLDGIVGRSYGGVLQAGYSVILPTPQDTPFLLRLSLENICALELGPCRELFVVGDGRAAPLSRLQRVIDELGDARVRLLPLSSTQRFMADRIPRADGGANFRHWVTIVRGVQEAQTQHLFLHDIDSFWAHPTRIREQYEACVAADATTMGVTERWDPFFENRPARMPATWELMFDTAWARSKRPSDHKGGPRQTAEGLHTFDTMLWPQFNDLASGRVKLMEALEPGDYVHFNGTITTLRTYQRLMRQKPNQKVIDEMFRLLLLSLWETTGGDPDEPRLTPRPDQLAEGMTDERAPIQYRGEQCDRGYGEFRQIIGRLASVNCFSEWRWAEIETMLRPFDTHFNYEDGREYPPAIPSGGQWMSSLSLI